MSTRRRLEALTADLADPPVRTAQPMPPVAARLEDAGVETRFPQAMPGVPAARTGPGQMLAFRGQMQALEGELDTLRQRLAQYADSSPARRLDTASIHPSRWANRHPAAFATPQFERLKADIESAGGNVQPILVREVADRQGQYEIVFGHRRHRACAELGLPVLAVVWAEPLSDEALFAAMERENRERADLSPFEQGAMYRRALDEQLYPSQRRLAEALGVSHTWVRKALSVAELPGAIIECFRSPLEIQHRHAQAIDAALETDRKAVLRRAEKLRTRPSAPSVVIDQLLAPTKAGAEGAPFEVRIEGKTVGRLSRTASGDVAIRLVGSAVPEDKLQGLLQAIERSLR